MQSIKKPQELDAEVQSVTVMHILNSLWIALVHSMLVQNKHEAKL